MKKIAWNNSLSVGVDSLDQQHKSLIGLLNMQIRHSKDGQGLEDLKDIIKRLKKYSQVHFNSEEKLFKSISYPNAEDHVKIHSSFIKQIEKYEKDLEAGRIGLPEEVKSFLQNWYLTHIKKEDSKYGNFLKEKALN